MGSSDDGTGLWVPSLGEVYPRAAGKIHGALEFHVLESTLGPRLNRGF